MLPLNLFLKFVNSSSSNPQIAQINIPPSSSTKLSIISLVEDIMSAPVINVPPDYSAFSSSRLMEQKRIRRLVVMENHKLCGIVTQTDIFKAVKKKLQWDIFQVYISNHNKVFPPIASGIHQLLPITNTSDLVRIIWFAVSAGIRIC